MSDYAPNPEAQDIYKGLAQQKLSDVTGSQIQNLTDPVFIQAENQDRLITMNIINEAAMRDGLPIPDSGGVAQYTQTSNAAAPIIRPPKGEVWNIKGISLFNSLSLTGNQAYYSFLSDQATLDLNDLPAQGRGDCQLSATSSASTTLAWETLHEDLGGGPWILNHNMFLRWYGDFANTQSGNVITFNVAFMRIR